MFFHHAAESTTNCPVVSDALDVSRNLRLGYPNRWNSPSKIVAFKSPHTKTVFVCCAIRFDGSIGYVNECHCQYRPTVRHTALVGLSALILREFRKLQGLDGGIRVEPLALTMLVLLLVAQISSPSEHGCDP